MKYAIQRCTYCTHHNAFTIVSEGMVPKREKKVCETGEFVSIQKPHSLCQEPQTYHKAETSVEERLFLEVKVPECI